MSKKPLKKIVIICHLDGLSNSVRPKIIKEFLESYGYEIKLLNELDLKFLRAKENFKMMNINRAKKNSLAEYYQKYPLIENREAFAETLLFYLKEDKYDAVICESAWSSYIFNKGIDYLKIYDCPTPESFELETGYEFAKESRASKEPYTDFYLRFSPEYIQELKKKELEVYKNADYLCFYWQSYAEYIKRHFYRGNNIFILNWGCFTKRKRAQWSNHPRILFLGNLEGYWVNKRLLSFLTKITPYDIDCYGKPKPKEFYNLNYKGYLANPDILNQYQFGLITITKDSLRKSGFSAKALEYVSYGLPVLMPRWRENKPKIGGCIYYNESDFISQIRAYLDRNKWKKKSDEAYEYAQRHSWNKQLQPLLDILDKSLK